LEKKDAIGIPYLEYVCIDVRIRWMRFGGGGCRSLRYLEDVSSEGWILDRLCLPTGSVGQS